jgi:hypothetical protein
MDEFGPDADFGRRFSYGPAMAVESGDLSDDHRRIYIRFGGLRGFFGDIYETDG